MRFLHLMAIVLICLAAAPAGWAQQIPGHDPDAPIEIEADNLEVRQDRQLAIFTGSVVAVQSGLTVTTDRMLVSYRQGGGGASVGGAISQLEAIGQVVITTARETARGQRGLYNVDQGTIDLQGNVELSNKDGQLRGQALRMDLASGVSTLTGGRIQGSTGGSGRVRGVFTPQKQDN